jgi:predicted nuclease with TOPRIM domain
MKKKLNALSADNNRLKGNLNTLDGKEKHQRKRVDEMNQQMVECEEKLRLANKEKVITLLIGSSTSLSIVLYRSDVQRVCNSL